MKKYTAKGGGATQRQSESVLPIVKEARDVCEVDMGPRHVINQSGSCPTLQLLLPPPKPKVVFLYHPLGRKGVVAGHGNPSIEDKRRPETNLERLKDAMAWVERKKRRRTNQIRTLNNEGALKGF